MDGSLRGLARLLSIAGATMKSRESKHDAALSDWEGEGRSAFSSSESEEGSVPCFPMLLPGYSAQQAWGFRDPTGAFSYEFCRVYGAPAGTGARGPFCQLDEGRSYWVVIWRAQGTAAEVHPVGRWITYAQARKLTGARLTFQRFSSAVDMREEVPRLLRVAEIVLEERRPVTPIWKQAA
jgi:hypothetical protein